MLRNAIPPTQYNLSRGVMAATRLFASRSLEIKRKIVAIFLDGFVDVSPHVWPRHTRVESRYSGTPLHSRLFVFFFFFLPSFPFSSLLLIFFFFYNDANNSYSNNCSFDLLTPHAFVHSQKRLNRWRNFTYLSRLETKIFTYEKLRSEGVLINWYKHIAIIKDLVYNYARHEIHHWYNFNL